MRPVLTDRVAVIGIVAGLVLWACCLTVLWGWAYDASGAFALRTVLTIFAASWLCLWRRDKLIRWSKAVLKAFHLTEKIPLEEALEERLGSSRQDVNKRMHILAAGAVLAVGCFVFGTVWIIASAAIATLLGQCFLFSDVTWKLIEWVTLFIGALPIGLGFCVMCFAAKVVRESGGRDIFGAGFRDWLWGVAVGIAGFAISWWFGANLIYLVFSIGAGILVIAFVAISRAELATHPRKRLLPFGPPAKHSEKFIAATYAGLGLVLIGQTRLLGDIFSLSLSRRMLWIFLTVSLLTYFLGRLGRKSKPPSQLQVAGALLGVAAGLLAQAAEWILCIKLSGWTSAAVVLGVATQIPIAAMAAMIISSQRRNFAFSGGSAGPYFTAIAGGLTVAIALFMLLFSFSAGWILMIFLPAAGVIAGGLGGAKLARTTFGRIQWVSLSVVLCFSMLMGLGATISNVGEITGPVQPGQWLSAMCRFTPASPTNDDPEFRESGVLPKGLNWRSELITTCLAGVFERRKGKWWIVATSADDLPARGQLAVGSKADNKTKADDETKTDDETKAKAPERVAEKKVSIWNRIYAAGANPQPPGVSKKASRWPPLSYSDPNFFRYARLNFVADVGCDFYDGVFLAPLPADHPQAWRCYNDRILRRCRRLAKGSYMEWVEDLGQYVTKETSGIVVLRTQVGPDYVRRALSITRTYFKVVDSGWAVVDFKPGRAGMDLLLLGPNEALLGQDKADILAFLRDEVKNAKGQLYLVPIEELWAVYVGVSPIYLSNPPGERLDDTPKLKGLQKWLEKTSAWTNKLPRGQKLTKTKGQ